VTRGEPGRRRWRIRRKRRWTEDVDIPAELGCCLFELVASVAMFVSLLLIPAALMLR
jgi:hypothetical protein